MIIFLLISSFILSLGFFFNKIQNILPIKKDFPTKKFISIAPAGLYGAYTLGITSFILDNYNTESFLFLGGSSGSWNSLIGCYKYNSKDLIDELLLQPFFEKSSVSKLQDNLSNYFFENYNSSDFNLDRLYMSVSVLDNFRLTNKVITNFTSLNDAIEGCRASCHIPLLTSKQFIRRYRDNIVFDGGFTIFPPRNILNFFIISANKYNSQNLQYALSGLIKRNFSKEIINELYNKGYKDSLEHKKDLDLYFNNVDLPFYMHYY